MEVPRTGKDGSTMASSGERLTGAHPVPPATPRVSRVSTLDGFLQTSAARDGLNVLDLEPLTTLWVETRNSTYRLIVSEGAAVFVQGGRFFPRLARARLAGASFGGSLLKIAWIGLGMRMELCGDQGLIVTTPVRRIRVEGVPDHRSH
jgi:hypothetical protein